MTCSCSSPAHFTLSGMQCAQPSHSRRRSALGTQHSHTKLTHQGLRHTASDSKRLQVSHATPRQSTKDAGHRYAAAFYHEAFQNILVFILHMHSRMTSICCVASSGKGCSNRTTATAGFICVGWNMTTQFCLQLHHYLMCLQASFRQFRSRKVRSF